MSHGDEIKELSQKLTVDSYTRNNVISSFHHKDLPIFGVQFHPEVEHSKYGKEIIKHFVENICKDNKEWDSSLQIERAVELIKNKVNAEDQNATVICALSGGVDSCVAAVLAQKAIGNRLLCLFINNGLLRKNEYEDVLARFKKDLNLNVKGVDASELFLSRLSGVSDPEKREKLLEIPLLMYLNQKQKTSQMQSF